ncbi:MAG: glycoside hydrolase family 3 C-terminal domain-containing protein [Myxococcota bacterium]
MGASGETRIDGLTGQDFWRTHSWPSFGAPSLWLSDGPHGLRKSRNPAQMGLADPEPATCFPTAAALAASWDRQLVEEIGRAIGLEARAQGVHVVLGPGLNLKRHPFGGRNFEYFSEDPLLGGTLAGAWVKGCQSVGVGACLKHFVANNQERHRMVLDVRIDERTLRELYLRGFEIAIRLSKPAAVMASYNLVNGVYATEHPLLSNVLRGEWGFDGFVVSDWGAVSDRVAALRAGLDLEMPGTGRIHRALLEGALREGTLSDVHVDMAVERLVAAGRRFGEPEAIADVNPRDGLAREAAAACCVLLQNRKDVLPLAVNDELVVIGQLAEEARYQGAGSSGVVPTRVVSVLDALRASHREIAYAPGYTLDEGPAPAWRSQALEVAAQASTVILVAGLPAHHESEGFDRTSLALPDNQVDLIEAVAQRCERVVVVLCNGSPVAMPWADRVSAIVEAYLGGQAGGAGIVDVLTGAVNPSGRLPETFVDHEAAHLAHSAWPRNGRQVRYREALYVGYRWFDTAEVDVRFPFGHGLSYTTFAYGSLQITVDEDDIDVSLEVSNTGSRAGAEVVQLYVSRPNSVVFRPAQTLQGFEKVHLQQGETANVRFRLDRRSFAHWSVAEGDWVVEGGEWRVRVGASSRDMRQMAAVIVPWDDGVTADEVPEVYRTPTSEHPPDDRAFAKLYGQPWPAPPPGRPFHRNTTLGELQQTWLGRGLYRIAVQQAVRTLGGETNLALRRMAEAAVAELPLRGLVTTVQALGWEQLDALLAALNGRPWSAMGRLLKLRRRRRAS